MSAHSPLSGKPSQASGPSDPVIADLGHRPKHFTVKLYLLPPQSVLSIN